MDHPSNHSGPPRGLRRALSRARLLAQRAVLIVSSVVIAGSLLALGVFIVLPDTAAEFTAGLRPALYHSPLPDDFDPSAYDYEQVFGVAHNSGDSVPATLTALAAGADVIEVDVVSMDGRLYSSHASPLPLFGLDPFRGPSLEIVWTAAAQTDIISFDLKESSEAYLELLLEFLTAHREEHQVIVTTHDPASLHFFADRMPEVARYYSIGDPDELRRLREDPDLVALIDGVSIKDEAVDEETARWLTERGLRMLVWTVNDIERANELISMGVGAITTDNLALLALFGGQVRGEETLPASATPIAMTTETSAASAPPGTMSRRTAPWRPRQERHSDVG